MPVGLRGELHHRGEGLPGDPLLIIIGSAMYRIWLFLTFLQEPRRNASEPMALGSAVFQRYNYGFGLHAKLRGSRRKFLSSHSRGVPVSGTDGERWYEAEGSALT